jgi:hypothetical protein
LPQRAILFFLLLASVAIAWRDVRAADDTLRQELASNDLVPDEKILKNLDKSITSWAELDDAKQFVIAYYVDDGTGLLQPPLFLDRYDRKSKEWKSAALPDAQAKSADTLVPCFGSVMSVTSSAGRLFLDTHINPSAGCTLILTADMKLETSLYGWLVGRLGEDTLIYHRSQIHFAPVHPAEVALYDLRTKRDVTIFPPKPEPAIRRARAAQLTEFYNSNEGWCNKNNDPCDPEYFDSDLQGEVATNEAESALALLISYEQIQLVQGDVQKPSGPKNVLYVYRGLGEHAKMEYREMLLEDASVRFGDVSLQNLLKPAVLRKIFSETPPKRPYGSAP